MKFDRSNLETALKQSKVSGTQWGISRITDRAASIETHDGNHINTWMDGENHGIRERLRSLGNENNNRIMVQRNYSWDYLILIQMFVRINFWKEFNKIGKLTVK